MKLLGHSQDSSQIHLFRKIRTACTTIVRTILTLPFLSIRSSKKSSFSPIPQKLESRPTSFGFMSRFFSHPGAYQMRQTRLTILLRIIEGQVTSTFLKLKNLGENQEKYMLVIKAFFTRENGFDKYVFYGLDWIMCEKRPRSLTYRSTTISFSCSSAASSSRASQMMLWHVSDE